jgi:hypothetical protein
VNGKEVTLAARTRRNYTVDEDTRMLAYKLRLQGLSLREIPLHLPSNPSTNRPYSHVAIGEWIKDIVEENRAPVREELREMEGQRLDVYIKSLHEKYELAAAKGRDADAQRWMALLLDVQQRRARLFGLDAPVVIDTHVTTEQVEDRELAARVQAAREAAQAAREAAQTEGVPAP